MFGIFKKKQKSEDHLMSIMEESHASLITAASSMADAAAEVVSHLKMKLDDTSLHLQSTHDIVKDALMLCDMDGSIKSFNYSSVAMFKRDDLGNLNLSDLLFNIPDGNLWDYLKEHFTLNKMIKLNTPTSYFVAELHTNKLIWSDGSSSMLILVRDTDQLMKIKRLSHERNKRYQSIFSSVFDGVIVEQNNKIIAANPSITKIFGYKSDELLGRPLSLLFHPEDYKQMENIVETDEDIQIKAIDINGNTKQIKCFFTKITWKDKEAQLIVIDDMNYKNRLENISHRNNGVDSVVCFDPSMKITFANMLFAKQYNTDRNTIIGDDIKKYVGKDVSKFISNLEKINSSNPSARYQTDENGRTIDWVDHAIFDEDGNPVEYQRIGRDITNLWEEEKSS